MDFKTTLRNLVLLPKTGYEQKREEFDYPEKTIAFLNALRDHYTKYHTTFALFYPSLVNNTLLTDSGSVASLEKAVELFSTNFPPSVNIFSNDSEIPPNVRMFLLLTTLGYTVSPQTMTSVNGKLFIAEENSRLAVLNRIISKGKNVDWFLELNGTTVLSEATMPLGSDIINVVNSVLQEAYEYYNAFSIPTLIKNDIYSGGAYWLKQIADVLNYTRTSLSDIDEMVSALGTVFYNRPVMNCFIQKSGEVGKVVLSSKDNALLTSKVMLTFNTIFGQWFSNLLVDTVEGINGLEFVCDIDPTLTSVTNMGSGYYCVMTDGKWDFIQHQVNYYLENNILKTVDMNTGEHNTWEKYSHIAIRSNMTPMRFYVANTKPQTLIFRRDTGEVLNWGNASGWLYDLIINVRKTLKNTWLNIPVQPNPYVKYFTSGKVTLQYLQSIQVRDLILKSEYGQDLYLFPAFLIEDSTLLSSDPYNPLNYRVDSVTVKRILKDAITYIANQLFTQDIAVLNLMSARFDQSIAVNNAAKIKLDSEYKNMKAMDANLQAKLLEAKNLFVTLDILRNKLANQADPVKAYKEQIQVRLNADLASFAASEKLRLANTNAVNEQLRLQAELNAAKAAQDAQIAAVNLATQKKEAEAVAIANNALIAEQQAIFANQQTAINAGKEIVSSINSEASITLNQIEPKNAVIIDADPIVKSALTAPKVEVKKSSNTVPLIAGAGVLAWIMFGRGE
jgi:hypothetical protein